jgi:hypothetical protein
LRGGTGEIDQLGSPGVQKQIQKSLLFLEIMWDRERRHEKMDRQSEDVCMVDGSRQSGEILQLGVSPPMLECSHYSWDCPIRYDDKQYTDAWCNVTLRRVHVEIAVHIPSNIDGRRDNFIHGPGEGEKSDVVMCPLIEIMGTRESNDAREVREDSTRQRAAR